MRTRPASDARLSHHRATPAITIYDCIRVSKTRTAAVAILCLISYNRTWKVGRAAQQKSPAPIVGNGQSLEGKGNVPGEGSGMSRRNMLRPSTALLLTGLCIPGGNSSWFPKDKASSLQIPTKTLPKGVGPGEMVFSRSSTSLGFLEDLGT